MTEEADPPDLRASPRTQWLLGCVGVLIALGGLTPELLEWQGNLFDDAYIYLRYAQNNLSGCVLEWNCGAGRVEGFTSPLYLALITILGLGFDLERAANWVGVCSWFVAIGGFVLLPVALGPRLGRGETRFPAGLASILIAMVFVDDQLIAINIASGMEGGLVACALLVVAWFAFDPSRLALIAPTLVIVRPELGLATLLQPLLGREHLRRAAIAAVVVFGVVTSIRLALFVDVFPNTFWAKSGGSADHLASGTNYLVSSATRFLPALLVLLGLFSAHRALRYLAAIVIAWCAYFLWSGGDFYTYARLAAFLVPAAAFVGVVALIELLQRRWTTTVTAVVAVLIVISSTWGGRSFRDTYGGGANAFTNVQTWAATGRWLNRCLPEASVAAVPIGALAYFSGSTVYDLVGLTDPVVAIEGERATGENFLVGHERAHPEWTLSLEPDVIFIDVSGPAPIDSRQRLDLMFPEGRLLDQIGSSRVPYASISAPVSPGNYQLLFVKKPIAVNHLSAECLQPAQSSH